MHQVIASHGLQRQTISQYIYINSNMPVVASFDPKPGVHLFLTELERRLKETPKADKQAWFQNVFQRGNLTDDMEDYKKKKLQKCF